MIAKIYGDTVDVYRLIDPSLRPNHRNDHCATPKNITHIKCGQT